MIETDYIVVGLGIAGICLCEQLEKHNKRFVVFDSALQTATKISGGVLNPVILKRFTVAWMAKEQTANAVSFYNNLSSKLGVSVFKENEVLRILTNAQEQNDWAVASDKRDLSAFLSSEIIKNNNPHIKAPFGFGKVNGGGMIFPSVLINTYKAYLQSKGLLFTETFDHVQIVDRATETSVVSEINQNIQYKNISAGGIIFSEGTAALQNPFFPKKFFIPLKGEYLIIKAPELKLEAILKGPVHIIPLGNDSYKVGATYDREDLTYESTLKARQEVIEKLRKMIHCEFEVVAQEVGMRPTTKDRRPLLGRPTPNSNKIFLNGLGNHGIMGAPFLSEILYKYLEEGLELPKEMDIGRWNKFRNKF